MKSYKDYMEKAGSSEHLDIFSAEEAFRQADEKLFRATMAAVMDTVKEIALDGGYECEVCVHGRLVSKVTEYIKKAGYGAKMSVKPPVGAGTEDPMSYLVVSWAHLKAGGKPADVKPASASAPAPAPTPTPAPAPAPKPEPPPKVEEPKPEPPPKVEEPKPEPKKEEPKSEASSSPTRAMPAWAAKIVEQQPEDS